MKIQALFIVHCEKVKEEWDFVIPAPILVIDGLWLIIESDSLHMFNIWMASDMMWKVVQWLD